MSNRKLILESNVRLAMKNSKSNRAAAKFLGVSYNTYKKYSEMYFENGVSLFEIHKNEKCIGIKKERKSFTIPIEKILNGEKPNYSVQKLKTRLFREGLKAEECGCCGFNERRITDYQIPLLINFGDGDKNNWKLENLEILCYNCYFLTVGNPLGKKKAIYI
tara:strand:- start:171 stop:656 length:486 start_codon:yes stop_codon:yes gene_type:complete